MTAKTITPDPKPTQSLRTRAGKAQLETAKAALATKKAADAAVKRKVETTADAVQAAPLADLAAAVKAAKPLTRAQKDAAIDKVAAEVPAIVAKVEDAIAAESVESPGDPLPTPDTEFENASRVDTAAAFIASEAVKKASAAALARRAANEADKITAKAKRAEDTAKRRTTINAFHATVVEQFKSGKSAKDIAASFTNEKTGEKYAASTINWILVKHGVVEKGAGRAKFNLDNLTATERNRAESALAAITLVADEHNVSVTTIVKAFSKV